MAPFLSRNMAVSPAIALHIPSPRSPFSCATSVATLTTTALSRTGLSANPQSPSIAVFSCFAVKWKLDDRRGRFRFAASVGADKAPGDEHQVNHLLGPVTRSLHLCKKVLHLDTFRMQCYLKEKCYLVWHNSSEGFHHSTNVSDSCDQQFLKVDNVELIKDKLLIDCDADQECVTGGIVALGKFDALHIGHRELAMQASKAGTPFLLSFVGMAEVLGWDYRAPVVAKCDRKRVLSSWAPYCRDLAPLEFYVEFSKVRHLTPRQFVERLAKELRISGVVAGENYRFGYKATGDASELVRLCKEYGLEAYIVSPVLDSKSNNLNKREWVSSTRVRQALAVGDVAYVSELLGRKHRLVLTVNDECVVEGNRICVPKTCMLNQQPKDGFYELCSLLIDGMLAGPCRVVIDARNIYMELDRTDGWAFPNWSCQFISVEFG